MSFLLFEWFLRNFMLDKNENKEHILFWKVSFLLVTLSQNQISCNDSSKGKK